MASWERIRHRRAAPAPRGKVRKRARPRARRFTEAKLEAQCVAWAHGRGWLSRKMNGLGFNSWEDRVLLPPARHGNVLMPPLWVELKLPGKAPTKLQRDHHRAMRRRGQVTRVVHTLAEFKATLEEHAHRYCA